MNDNEKTRGQLVEELAEMCQRVAGLKELKTRREQVVETLQESEEKPRSLISSMDDLMFTLDENGVFVEYYQSADDSALYVSPKIFLAKPFKNVLPPHVAELLQQFPLWGSR